MRYNQAAGQLIDAVLWSKTKKEEVVAFFGNPGRLDRSTSPEVI
jgi:hypothetical protein